jgi:hypothetical protein
MTSRDGHLALSFPDPLPNQWLMIAPAQGIARLAQSLAGSGQTALSPPAVRPYGQIGVTDVSCRTQRMCTILSNDDREEMKEDVMSTLLATATAVEDNVLDTMKMAEDAAVHTARTFVEGFEPIIKWLPELPAGGLVPAPADIVDHGFGFVDRLVANLRDFATTLVAMLPKVEVGPTAVKAAPKAHAA